MNLQNFKRNIISRLLLLHFIVIILTLFVGCLGSPEDTPEENAKAKRFDSIADSSVIYVYRNTLTAALQTFRLYLDDTLFVGDSKNESFFRLVTNAGNHKLIVTNVRNNELNTLPIYTDSGKIYFVEMQIGANVISGQPELVVMEDSTAKSEILKCNLLKTGEGTSM